MICMQLERIQNARLGVGGWELRVHAPCGFQLKVGDVLNCGFGGQALGFGFRHVMVWSGVRHIGGGDPV